MKEKKKITGTEKKQPKRDNTKKQSNRNKKKTNKSGQKKEIAKFEPTDQPFTNVDEEISKINRKIKEHTKKLQIPHSRLEEEIEKELTITQKALRAAMKLKFYVATYTIALGILAYFLGYPKSFFTQFIFAWVLLWIGYHFHKHNYRYKFSLKVFYIGVMIIPLYIIYLELNDLLSLTLIILYSISFIVALALYLHHISRGIQRELHQSFTKTFLIVWFSHIIALTITVLIMYFLPYIILPNHFVSIIYLLLLWLIPGFFAYFFLNKFFYLRFFDPLHIRKDAIKGLKHSLTYTGIFIGLIILIYLLTAIQLTMTEHKDAVKRIDQSIREIDMIKTRIDLTSAEPTTYGLKQMEVTQEILDYAEELRTGFQSKRDDKQIFGLNDYLNDNYFTKLSKKRLALTFLLINKRSTIIATDDLIRDFKSIEEKDAKEALKKTKEYVDTNYRPYQESQDLKTFKDYIYNNKENYEKFMVDDALLSFALSQSDSTGINILAPGNSLFSKQTYYTTSHLKIFREILITAFENTLYNARDVRTPAILDKLYYNRETSESDLSKAVRYKMLAENLKANIALV